MNVEKYPDRAINEYAIEASTTAPHLITIGITNYNCNSYLDECIASILNQSYKPIEIIIADDNSKDGSKEKIEALVKQHDNIKAIYHSNNMGCPDPGRQEILDAARGSFFMLVDSDDYFAEKDTVSKLLYEFEKYPELDYVYCNMLVVDKTSSNTGLWAYRQYSDDELIHDTFQRGGSGVIPMKGMFKKDFFIKNGLSWHSNETAGDTLSALIYTRHGWKYRHLNLDLICYRQYGESFTFNLEKRIKAICRILEYIVDNFSEEIYFSKIPWDHLQPLTRYNIKMYLLGQFYYELLKVYHGQWTSRNSPQGENSIDMAGALKPLKEKILFYFSRCKTPNLFNSNISEILRDIDTL